MSEDSNEKTGGSGVETLEPRERAEAPDNRIAPSAPRGEEGASVGGWLCYHDRKYQTQFRCALRDGLLQSRLQRKCRQV